jgi:hypothetical protein
MAALVFPNRTIGWHTDIADSLSRFLSHDKSVYGLISTRMQKRGLWDRRAREPLTLGMSQIEVGAFEFGEWRPPEKDFTRGAYLRHVWQQLYMKNHK